MMILLLLAGLAMQAPPPDLGTRPAGADWPCFLGPSHDGCSTERGLQFPWPAAGPRIVWQRELGESYGACSVQRGRLFVFDRSNNGKYRLACLKSETGEPIWTFEYAAEYQDAFGASNGPRCCPVVDDDRVYTVGPDGLIHCVRVADGSLLWKRDTASDFKVVPNFFGVGSTPVVEGELLIAMIGGSPPGSPDIMSGETRGAGSGIVGFDKRTGDVKYKLSDELASYSSPIVTTINGRRLGLVFARGALIGFDPAAGKIEFQHPWRARSVTTVNISNPVVGGDLVLVSEAYGMGSSVVRVKPGGVDVVWQDGRKRDRALQAYWNTPIHVDGHVYGSNGTGGDADLRCVELATGTVKWSSPEIRQCSLLSVDGRFIGLGEDGTLYLLKLSPEKADVISRIAFKGKDGTPLLQSPARAAPVLSHGLLYVRGTDRLLCLEVIPPQAEDKEIVDLSRTLQKDPKDIHAYSARGDAYFKAGRFKESVADFEKMVELDPQLDAGHWRRGIAYFYAGQYEKAAKQFEAYRSHDDVDRENGIWRYFSQAKAYGMEKAKAGLLKYAKDDREPFPDVYQLFEGKRTPAQILAKINDAKLDDDDRQCRLFYAQLYIGLNYAVENKPEEAKKHLQEAVASKWGEKAGYGPAWMWNVGRVHYEQLTK